MKDFVREVQEAYSAGFHQLSLFGLLAIPDIYGAMSQEDGEASKKHYVDWYDRYVNPYYNIGGVESLSGEDAYYWRGSVLHQGRASPREKRQEHEGYNRIAFAPPIKKISERET